MFEKFKRTANEMFAKEDRLLLAVSGGVDSMVMLHLFCSTEYHFAVAHCNFSLRGEESDADTQLVTDFCAARGIKLHKVTFDTHREMERTGESVQMAARRLRYEWFYRIAQEGGYDRIAIAHNSGDTIETFFINLIRHTGIRGLVGITTVRDLIARPLMSFARDEILQYAFENGVVWREDASNSGTKYLRNKIRHIVLPQLREIEPDFDAVMLSNMGRVGAAVSFIDQQMEEIRSKVLSTCGDRMTLLLSEVAQYKPFEFVVYELLSPFGFNTSVITQIVDCYRKEGSGRFESPLYEGQLGRGVFVFALKGDADLAENQTIRSLDDPINGFVLELLDEVTVFDADPNIAYFDAEKVLFPLTVRRWQEGDRFVPFGMTGHKKISDFFVDSKINVVDKSSEKLLTDVSGAILWVVGRRSDNRYRVARNSKKILKITYNGV